MEKSIGELKGRVVLGSLLIQMLRGDDDPRAAKAIVALQDQQREINEILVRRIREEREARGEAEPDAVVIGMKPAVMRARALRR